MALLLHFFTFDLMIIQLTHRDKNYRVDLSKGTDLSSRYGLKPQEPKAWHTPDVQISPVVRDGWIGAVAQGSPVNFFDVALNPHGNGTHTESIGHIRKDHFSINNALSEFHFMARLIRLRSEQVGEDRIVRKAAFLEQGLPLDISAVIVVVDDFAPNHDFSGTNAPYFEAELLTYLKEAGIVHFLTNLPSVDREEDGGALAAHHAFWYSGDTSRESATISELLQVPPQLKEGLYFLNLQVAPLHNDAAPSRVMVYALKSDK
jgi:kynurenine formamidase